MRIINLETTKITRKEVINELKRANEDTIVFIVKHSKQMCFIQDGAHEFSIAALCKDVPLVEKGIGCELSDILDNLHSIKVIVFI